MYLHIIKVSKMMKYDKVVHLSSVHWTEYEVAEGWFEIRPKEKSGYVGWKFQDSISDSELLWV
jgi:hypothetical protein